MGPIGSSCHIWRQSTWSTIRKRLRRFDIPRHRPRIQNWNYQNNLATVAWGWKCLGLLCCSRACPVHRHRIYYEFFIVSEGEENERPSVQKLKLKRMWTMQHDSDPKHSSKSTKEWLKEGNGEFWNGQVKARILILLRCCGVIWNGLCMQETPQTLHSWNNSACSAWRNGKESMSEIGRQL